MMARPLHVTPAASARLLSNGVQQASTPRPMTEKQLQSAIVQAAGLLGFTLIYHTWLSARSTPGFPDLLLLSPDKGRILAVEVKGERGVVSAAQRQWLDGLDWCGIPAHVWRPIDWHNGTVERVLRGG